MTIRTYSFCTVPKYVPTIEEINEEIQALQSRLKDLRTDTPIRSQEHQQIVNSLINTAQCRIHELENKLDRTTSY